MTNDDTRSKPSTEQPESDPVPKDAGDSASGNRPPDPVFTDFDEDEDYEESDRDTDYASAYEDEESGTDDYLEPPEGENPDDKAGGWQVVGVALDAERRPQASGGNPWDVKASTGDDNEEEYEEEDIASDTGDLELEPERELFEYDGEAGDEGWEEPEEYLEEEQGQIMAPGEPPQQWPWSLVVVGVVALTLLAAGGYGVIQQRSVAQEEIRQLQASLATAANPGELAAGREALRDMEERIARSQATIDELTLENKRLTDTVAGLEQQLTAQKSVVAPAKKAAVAKAAPASAAVSKPAPASKPAAAPKPASAAATASGDWFVNFSSYGQRSIAESWVKKLKPSLGKAIVAEGSRDGKTFYRVRIVGLTDRGQAKKVAAQLQAAHGLPPLWVGKD